MHPEVATLDGAPGMPILIEGGLKFLALWVSPFKLGISLQRPSRRQFASLEAVDPSRIRPRSRDEQAQAVAFRAIRSTIETLQRNVSGGSTFSFEKHCLFAPAILRSLQRTANTSSNVSEFSGIGYQKWGLNRVCGYPATESAVWTWPTRKLA